MPTQQLRLNGIPARPLMLIRVILENMVHLLERAAFRLGDKEECPDAGKHAEDGEEDVGAVAGAFH